MIEREQSIQEWEIIGRPGFFGKRKDELVDGWNREYGAGNWRIVWELANGEVINFEEMFFRVYVTGYMAYFQEFKYQAVYLTDNFSFAYDKDLITRAEAFNPYALYEKPGKANQFHNVALNMAIEWFLNMSFKGEKPIQVRQGRPGTDSTSWPLGWQWSPGYIPAIRRDLIPAVEISSPWWERGSIEDLYQRAKVIQVRKI